MTPELKAAAERMRTAAEKGWMEGYSERPMFGHPFQQIADWQIIADAFLDEHPPDDDTPIDEAVLLRCGFVKDFSDLELWTRHGDEVMGLTVHKSGRWKIGSGSYRHTTLCELHCPPQTLGELRRLCQSLGITLNEGEATHVAP